MARKYLPLSGGGADRGRYFIWNLTQLNVRPYSRAGLLRYKIAPGYPLPGPFNHSGVGRGPEVAGPIRSYNLVFTYPVREAPRDEINSAPPGDGTLTVAWTNSGDDEVTGYELRLQRLNPPRQSSPGHRMAIPLGQHSRDQFPWSTPLMDWSTAPTTRSRPGGETNTATGATGATGTPIGPRGTPRTTPGVPWVQSASQGNGFLTVVWSHPANTGGVAITAYDLRYIRHDATDKVDANWTVLDSVWARQGNPFRVTRSVSTALKD